MDLLRTYESIEKYFEKYPETDIHENSSSFENATVVSYLFNESATIFDVGSFVALAKSFPHQEKGKTFIYSMFTGEFGDQLRNHMSYLRIKNDIDAKIVVPGSDDIESIYLHNLNGNKSFVLADYEQMNVLAEKFGNTNDFYGVMPRKYLNEETSF